MQPTRIDEIDGLRALAMTGVVAQHCGIAPFGWTGVWLFFVISGYVISRNFLDRAYVGDDWKLEYRNFMKRRFFRIVPVYSLYVAVGCVILVSAGKSGALRDVLFLMTFTHNWQMIFNLWPNPESWSAFGHLWTLSIEEQFYVVYPLLFLLLRPRQYVIALVVLIAAGPIVRFVYSAALAAASNDAGWIAFAVYAASFAHFDAFLLGALIAWFGGRIRRHEWVPHAVCAIAVLAAGVYAFSYWSMNRAAGATGVEAFRNIYSGILYGSGREVFVYSAVNLLAAAALIYAILRKPITRPLAWPFVSLVGRISYGGYLYHALVLWLAFTVLPIGGDKLPVAQRLVLFVCVWLATVAVVYVSYRWFELPIMNWSRRTDARQSRNLSVATALEKSH